MNTQTDTPQTDAHIKAQTHTCSPSVNPDFARSLERELNEARRRLAMEWSKEEVEDQWAADIDTAHPANYGADDSQVDTALEMVSHRHRKWSLVALVNWLLLEQKKIQQQRDRLADALAYYMSQFGQALDCYKIPYGEQQENADRQARIVLKEIKYKTQ